MSSPRFPCTTSVLVYCLLVLVVEQVAATTSKLTSYHIFVAIDLAAKNVLACLVHTCSSGTGVSQVLFVQAIVYFLACM